MSQKKKLGYECVFYSHKPTTVVGETGIRSKYNINAKFRNKQKKTKCKHKCMHNDNE